MSYQLIDHCKDLPELAALLDLRDPPETLFVRGTWDPSVFTECVAIVGSRKMTSYGRAVIDQIVPELVLKKKTIISGFMYGVDQYVHKSCIENGGRTIAVLGFGIGIPLEDEDEKLALSIISHGGLLLSEWESQRGSLWTFPVRNRIVAALSTDVIVVEAALKSGSLITANISTKLHRNLWAVPGPITSKVSEGTNLLIADGQAKMWRPDNRKDPSKKSKRHSDPILALLENEALRSDEVARQLGISIAQVGAQLSLFAITGEVIERDGKYSLS